MADRRPLYALVAAAVLASAVVLLAGATRPDPSPEYSHDGYTQAAASSSSTSSSSTVVVPASAAPAVPAPPPPPTTTTTVAPATVTTAPAPPPPAGGGDDFARLAACESTGDRDGVEPHRIDPTAVSPSGTYRGAFQFDADTWASVGGTGDPAAHSYAHQLELAKRLQADRGWGPWPHCSELLGLR